MKGRRSVKGEWWNVDIMEKREWKEMRILFSLIYFAQIKWLQRIRDTQDTPGINYKRRDEIIPQMINNGNYKKRINRHQNMSIVKVFCLKCHLLLSICKFL